MTKSEFQEKYDSLYSKYKHIITDELKSSYSHYCSNFSSFWEMRDFGGHVALPLFAIWAIITICFLRSSSIAMVTISTLFVVFVIWLYHWWASIAERVCDHFFWKYEYKSVIALCIKRLKSHDLRAANSQEEIDCIEEFYEQCERYIVNEFFSYK